MNPRSARLYSRLAESWFILPHVYLALARAWMDAETALSPGDMPKKPSMPYALDSGVAIVPMQGFMATRVEDWEKAYGVVDTAEVGDAIESAVNDPSVRAILLDVDSPGGTVQGTPELAARVNAANKIKPVVAYTGAQMASAAYYVGSQASAVLSSPSAIVGSIGTVMSFYDVSKMFEGFGVKAEVITNADSPLKGMGFPGTSLSEQQREFLQAHVDESAALFKSTVMSSRPGVSADGMNGGFFTGTRSLALGLVDECCDMKRAKRTAMMMNNFQAKN